MAIIFFEPEKRKMKNKFPEIVTLLLLLFADCNCDAMLNIFKQIPFEKKPLGNNLANTATVVAPGNINWRTPSDLFSALRLDTKYFRNIIYGENVKESSRYISQDFLLQTLEECIKGKSALDSLYAKVLQDDSVFNAIQQQLINPCHPVMESLFSNCFYEIGIMAMTISSICFSHISPRQIELHWEENEGIFDNFWNKYYGKLAHLLNSSVASPDREFYLSSLKRDFRQVVEDYLMGYLTFGVIVEANLEPILFSSPLSDTFLMENVTSLKDYQFVQVLKTNSHLLENFYIWKEIAILYTLEVDFIEQSAGEASSKNIDRLKTIEQTLRDIANIVFKLDLPENDVTEDQAFFKSGLYNIWNRTRNLVGILNGLEA